MDSSCRKTFISHNHGQKNSISNSEEDKNREQQPILSDHNRESSSGSGSLHHRRHMSRPSEVIVKIDGGGDQPATIPTHNNRIHRESSLDFWKDEGNRAMQETRFDVVEDHDPPSKLIGHFLNKQKAAGGEFCLDVDLEMEEWRDDRSSNSSPRIFSPLGQNLEDRKAKEVSFSSEAGNSRRCNVVDICPDEQDKMHDISTSSDEDEKIHHRRRRSIFSTASNADPQSGNDGQVLKCTSIQRRYSGVGSVKTKSRLMDPPEATAGMMNTGQLRSDLVGRASGLLSRPGDEDEDDPLFDDDFPEEYKTTNFDALTIAQWISLIIIVSALICTTTIAKLKRARLRGLHIWKWEVLILVLICGRLVSGWGIRIVVLLIERNFFMRKRVLYFVYGIRKAVQNCIWLGLVLIAWHSMFHQDIQGDNSEFLWYVNKVMICMLVGTLLWLVKTLMVKVLASCFHVSTFFDRIQESLFNQYIIEALSGQPHIEIKKLQDEEEKTMAEVWKLQNAGATLPPELRPPTFQRTESGRVVGATVTAPSPATAPTPATATPGCSGGLAPKPTKGVSFKISGPMSRNQDDQGTITIDHLHKLNHKNISAWNMKRLIKVVKNGVLVTLDERVQDSSQDDENTTQIRSECEAKAAARKIFRNVAKPRAKYIYLEDLMRFLHEDEALKTLNAVEGSTESERISKASLKHWVVNAFIERRALSLTLNDTKTAVNKLHHMVNVLVGIIIVIICLVILDIATSKFLLYISSQIVVVAFVFGNTCKTIFEAIIFVFIIHPFDVGDRCEVDGVQMIVEEMNILTTVFLRFDNQKICYPNVTLATKPIGNYYRSPDMGDSVDFAVHIATPAEKIAIIKQRIIAYLESRSDYWYPEPTVVLMNMDQLNMMKLSVWMRHRMNHQNMGERFKRRALVVEELVKNLKEFDIEYRLYPLDINVRSMPTPNSSRLPPTWTPPTTT